MRLCEEKEREKESESLSETHRREIDRKKQGK